MRLIPLHLGPGTGQHLGIDVQDWGGNGVYMDRFGRQSDSGNYHLVCRRGSKQ